MTAQELAQLRAEITAKVDPAVVALRDTQAIAEAVSVGRTRRTLTEIGHGLILETLGLQTGNTVLDLVHNDENLRYVRPLLEQGRLVASSVLVQQWLQGLVAYSVLTQEQADAIIALGHEPAPVDELDVRRAAWSAYGEWLL